MNPNTTFRNHLAGTVSFYLANESRFVISLAARMEALIRVHSELKFLIGCSLPQRALSACPIKQLPRGECFYNDNHDAMFIFGCSFCEAFTYLLFLQFTKNETTNAIPENSKSLLALNGLRTGQAWQNTQCKTNAVHMSATPHSKRASFTSAGRGLLENAPRLRLIS